MKAFPVLIAAIVSFVIVLTIDLLNINRQSGEHIVNMYFYGPITIVVTMFLGYIGSLFGPELSYKDIKEFTLAKKKS